MIVKLQTEQRLEFLSLKGGCRGLSESTLVKLPHCWKSHVTSQMILPELSLTAKLHAEQHLEFLSLKGGCRGSSESTLVKMHYCWKSHVAAHLCYQAKRKNPLVHKGSLANSNDLTRAVIHFIS